AGLRQRRSARSENANSFPPPEKPCTNSASHSRASDEHDPPRFWQYFRFLVIRLLVLPPLCKTAEIILRGCRCILYQADQSTRQDEYKLQALPGSETELPTFGILPQPTPERVGVHVPRSRCRNPASHNHCGW